MWLHRIVDHDGVREGEGGIERWLRLGEAAGLDRKLLWSAEDVLPGVRLAVDGYVNFCRLRSSLEAVAASLTELSAPGLMSTRIAAFEYHCTDEWVDVMRQAGELGVVHTRLSGGEPLMRRDLPEIVAAADSAGIYTQLVTSGVGLTRERLAGLTDRGLRSVQLSVQHAEPASSDRIAGHRSFDAKRKAAALVREAGLPLDLNVVLHQDNLDALDALIDLALDWGAERIELANTQFYGWALVNRDRLLPGREQIDRARAVVEARRERLAGRIDVVWVVPDYVEGAAKPCVGGWGAVSLTVAPDGTVLPCPAAATLPGLDAPNVRDHSLEWTWHHSPAFNRYRGTDWMADPCRSCPQRDTDLGGCRCQAYAPAPDHLRGAGSRQPLRQPRLQPRPPQSAGARLRPQRAAVGGRVRLHPVRRTEPDQARRQLWLAHLRGHLLGRRDDQPEEDLDHLRGLAQRHRHRRQRHLHGRAARPTPLAHLHRGRHRERGHGDGVLRRHVRRLRTVVNVPGREEPWLTTTNADAPGGQPDGADRVLRVTLGQKAVTLPTAPAADEPLTPRPPPQGGRVPERQHVDVDAARPDRGGQVVGGPGEAPGRPVSGWMCQVSTAEQPDATHWCEVMRLFTPTPLWNELSVRLSAYSSPG
jgi:pyrroloquinoline quinone biosynthesis protein E